MNAVIIGGSGGIGRAFIEYLLFHHEQINVTGTYFQGKPNHVNDNRCQWYCLDVTCEKSIADFCKKFASVDLFINTAGLLHNEQFKPEKSTKHINADYFQKLMSINALPTLLFSKYLAPGLKRSKSAVFATVSARVGSIEENYLGGWYSYRASKAALNMILKNLSIEWQRSMPHVSVAALHPGTTDTKLSRPFQKNVPEGQLLSAEESVRYMMNIIEQITPQQSGRFWSFDQQQLPW